MKDIKTLTSQMEKAQAAYQRVSGDHERAVETIDSETRYDDDLAALRTRRTEEQGRALVLKRKADTTKLDGEIEVLEKQRGAAIEAANVARAAIPIFDEALHIARTELANLHAEHRAAIEAYVMAAHDAAQARYLQAVADMETAVAEMVGSELAWRAVLQTSPNDEFPGRGKQVLEDIRTTGVRVPWDHSRLKNPAVAAKYTADYRDYWYLPAWATREQHGFGDACARQLVDGIRDTGFECPCYVGYQAPEVRTVKVRILRGTIPGEERVTRSAKTGEIVSRRSTNYGPGDFLEMDESQARALAARGTVAIHGEESPVENETDAAPPIRVTPQSQRPVGSIGPSRTLDGYCGHFHALDMRGYE